jgi:predicted homoserine dehydrogenase-like protein
MAVLTADHRYTLTNSANPSVQVAATPKTKLLADHFIAQGVGSFELRGEAVAIKDYADCVPISLLEHARLKRPVSAGEYIKFKDVNLPESKALAAWMKTLADLGYYTPRKARPKKVTTTPQSSQSNWTNSLLNMFNLLKVSHLFPKKVWYGSK